MPKLLVKNEPKEVNVIDTDLLDRVRRLREDMNEIELKAPPPDEQPSSIPAPEAGPTGQTEQTGQTGQDDNSSKK